MAISVNSSIVPNIGNVVNQNQGFVMNVTVSSAATDLVDLQDCVLKITSVSAGIVVGVGLNVPIGLPTVAIGGSATVAVVFETDPTITVGGKMIEFELDGYLGGPEWLVTGGDGECCRYETGLRGLFPSIHIEESQTVEIVAE